MYIYPVNQAWNLGKLETRYSRQCRFGRREWIPYDKDSAQERKILCDEWRELRKRFEKESPFPFQTPWLLFDHGACGLILFADKLDREMQPMNLALGAHGGCAP